VTYDLILADPPWRYDFSRTRNRKIENQYPTMELSEIAALNPPAADDCVLYLWGTAPKLIEALHIMDGWGFTYVTNAVWDKEIIGMGYYFRGQHEHLLVGKRGSPRVPAPGSRVSSVIRSRRTRHSSKPAIVHEILEAMYPDARRLEMFARSARPGWHVWGNEVSSDVEMR
jgi:N6-adenosine-specific RNA methylase IME4